jgi:hypothetical protein
MEHASMQIVWLQRRQGTTEWARMTGCVVAETGRPTQVILSKRFNLPGATSSRSNDDTYAAFPSEEAEYAELTSVARWASMDAAAQARGVVDDELTALRNRLAEKEAETEELRKKASKKAEPKASPADPGLAPFAKTLNATLDRLVALHERKEKASDERPPQPTEWDVATWADRLEPSALPVWELKLAFWLGVNCDSKPALEHAFHALCQWARGVAESGTPLEDECMRQGKLLLRAVRDVRTAAKGVDVDAVHAALKKGGDADLCTKGYMTKDVYALAVNDEQSKKKDTKATPKAQHDGRATTATRRAIWCWYCGQDRHTAPTCNARIAAGHQVPQGPRDEAKQFRTTNGLPAGNARGGF